MKVVWQLEKATVRDVYETLRKRRQVAYTTVMTMMKILEDKGTCKKSMAERAYVYVPSRPRQQVVRAMVRDFVERVFDGATSGLLLHLAKDGQLTKASATRSAVRSTTWRSDGRDPREPSRLVPAGRGRRRRRGGRRVDDARRCRAGAPCVVAAVLVVCLALPILQPWHAANPLRRRCVIDDEHGRSTMSSHRAADSDPRRAAAAASDCGAPPWRTVVVVGSPSARGCRPLAWLARGSFVSAACGGSGLLRQQSDAFEGDLGSPPAADVRYVDHVGQPVTFGIRHPVVLLPSTLRALPEPVQHAVLAHELWHVRRRDWAWVVVEEALRATLWFHPAMWWLISRIQSSREEVVDELTLLVTGSRRHYLEALLAFADQPPLFAAAPFARRQHLYQRMLLLSKEAVMSSKRIVASCAGMALVLAAGGRVGRHRIPACERRLKGRPRRVVRHHRPYAIRVQGRPVLQPRSKRS